MPLFHVNGAELLPYARLNPGPDLYESDLQKLAWSDLEAFTGEALFPVAQQPPIPGGGRPDILALTHEGCVVVIEIKRDVNRSQLAQVLEYAGWGRSTNLDEIADLYDISPDHRGPDKFFADWVEFTDTQRPVLISGPARLVLIAQDFHARTRDAFSYLEEAGVPISFIPVAVYRDPAGQRVLHVDSEHEVVAVEAAPGGEKVASPPTTINGQRVSVGDLVQAGYLAAGESVVFNRPRLQQRHEATINGDGTFTLADGRTFNSPSLAAVRAAELVSYDGWFAWRVPRLGDTLLKDLRLRYVADELRRLEA